MTDLPKEQYPKDSKTWKILRQIEALMQSLVTTQNELFHQILFSDHPKIVCICGSILLVKEFQKANLEESLNEKIVLSASLIDYNEEDLRSPENRSKIEFMNREKIKIADEVLILNKDGYVDDATYDYFLLALGSNKKIRWLEPEKIPSICLDLIES